MRKARRIARGLQASASLLHRARLTADIVWLCVPDSQIAGAAAALRGRDLKGKIVFHASGILSSRALRDLSRKGASVASVHPLMTFIPQSLPDLRDAIFDIEGDRRALTAARTIVRRLQARPLELHSRQKPAYHAFATMICPLLVSLLASAEKFAAEMGLSRDTARKGMMPIVRQTLANYGRLGPNPAFTGPIVRGDTETINQHRMALAGDASARAIYAALGRAALKNLPVKNADKINSLLDGFRQTTRRNRKRTHRANTPAVRRS
jgi:predicted short-subunit dehydrogenase-like oxidoreductase (DUF2520 family)